MPTLIEKLGVKPGSRVWVLNAPPILTDELHQLERIEWTDGHGTADYIHYFATHADGLYGMLPEFLQALSKDGSMWISWPKKAARVPSDLDRETVREILLSAGLVDVKVCAVDDVWSALKFVRPLKDR